MKNNDFFAGSLMGVSSMQFVRLVAVVIIVAVVEPIAIGLRIMMEFSA